MPDREFADPAEFVYTQFSHIITSYLLGQGVLQMAVQKFQYSQFAHVIKWNNETSQWGRQSIQWWENAPFENPALL